MAEAYEAALYMAPPRQEEETAGIEPFNYHDLKAKGISDTTGDKQAAGGHRTPAMVSLYDRKKPEVEPTR